MQLIYDGSAFDTEHLPAEPRLGQDGKPIKRKYTGAHKLIKTPIDTYDLWGVKFPKGEAIEVPPAMVARKMVEKAMALKCFSVAKPSSLAEVVPPAPEAVAAEPEAEAAPKRHRFGRKRADEPTEG
jgi:hypothetical protein